MQNTKENTTEATPATDPKAPINLVNQIVPGYRKNPLGHLVPEANISSIDKMRDEFVRGLIEQAIEVSDMVGAFKTSSMSEISKFVELAAMEFNVTIGGSKGNLTLTSYDGQYRVMRAIDETITFNEGMTTARELIFKCIETWTAGANQNLATLVTRAFEKDKNGHLSTSRVLSLRSYEIDDPSWETAMDMISKSIQVQATVHYLRFYKRNKNGKWEQISLDPGITT